MTSNDSRPTPVAGTPHAAHAPKPVDATRISTPSCANRVGTTLRSIGPGVLATLVAAGLAVLVGKLVPNLSPLLIAIVLGVLWRNTLPVPGSWAPGIKVSAKKLLRTGIVLLGLQVSLAEVLGLGAWTILLVIAAVAVTFVATLLIGRALGIPLAQRILIASGFSICGAAAVAAAEGVIDAKEEDVATAIALVVVFGTLMIPLLPLAVAVLGLDGHTAGLWIGASTHEVAQVVAAGGLVGGTALAVAVTVKLARVVMLAPVMAVLGVWRRRELAAQAANATSTAAAATATATIQDAQGPARDVGSDPQAVASAPAKPKLPPIVPLFVLGFIAAMLVRTWVPLPAPVFEGAALVQQVLLAAAMFALGLGVHVKSMLKVGGRPVVLAALSTALILAVGLGGALLIPA